MLLCLEDLPALSRSWLAPLEEADPDLYAELAESIVIGTSGESKPGAFSAKVGIVLTVLDLRGKEIGAFRFAPATEGGTASQQLLTYDARMGQSFDAPPDVTFLGEYGSGHLLAGPDGIALFDPEAGRTVQVAPDFESFLVVQANAYDAYKAHMVKGADEPAYRLRQAELAAHPRFAAIDIEAVFTAQLKA